MPSDRKPLTDRVLSQQQATVKELWEYYDQGKKIAKHAKLNKCSYLKAIKDLKISESSAYKSHKFAKWSRDDVRYLTGEKREGKIKAPLSWSHVVVLVAVKDDSERRQWMERAVEGTWSAAELRSKIPLGEEPAGKNLRPRSGRRFKEEEGPAEMIQALDGYLKRPSRYLTFMLRKKCWGRARRRQLKLLQTTIKDLTELASRERSAKKSVDR
ncbi:MAG TPA: hypothetical protein VM165_11595 [Planctomycetaceae bacterium]|nr:hypothetical protein [Planctomycetaceae bacterium]